MGNPSTVWAQLAGAWAALGEIPYVNSDNVTITADPTNLWFDPVNKRLSVKTAGDQTGTDSINVYNNIDSYWTNTAATAFSSPTSSAGFTISSARISGSSPASSQTGDFLGHFSGWGYTSTLAAGAQPQFMELGGINVYAVGTNASANGLGGEVRLFTKQDNIAVPVEWVGLSNLGQLYPIVDQTVTIGKVGYGYSGLYLSYTIAGSTGAVTINKPAGKAKIAAGQNSVVVTNSLVSVNSIILLQVEGTDATAFYARVTPGSGSFTITLNANATGTVIVDFVVLRTDT